MSLNQAAQKLKIRREKKNRELRIANLQNKKKQLRKITKKVQNHQEQRVGK